MVSSVISLRPNGKIAIMKTLYFFLISLGMSFGLIAQNTTTYTITFESNWSNSTHPHPEGAFPSNAHWSRLVGATHTDENVFLEMGGLATPGVEDIAETGSNELFEGEVNTAITQGWADQYIFGDPLSTGLGQIVIEDLEVDTDFPYLTLLSMIAPSPDWMIAINSIPLLDENGQWIQEIEITLYPYDAGTDSGVDYNSANQDTDPQEPISSLQGVVPFSNESIGTLTIQRSEILSVSDRDLSVALGPNPFSSRLELNVQQPVNAVRVYNSIGSLVQDQAAEGQTFLSLDTASWTSGLYLVAVEFDSGQTTVVRAIKN